MSVFKLDPKPVYKRINDCLRQLSMSLSDLAETALAELPGADNIQNRGQELSFDSCVRLGDQITECLLIADGKPRGSFLLLGDLQPVGSAPKPDMLENFKPSTSLQLFELLSNLYSYASFLKGARIPNVVSLMEAILVRSVTLADSIAYCYRFVDSDLLVRIVKNEPGSEEEQTKLAQNYVGAVGKRAQLIIASIKDEAAAERLTRACMINLPACLTFPVAKNQRCINGMYFPPEVEQALLQKLADSQTRTIIERG